MHISQHFYVEKYLVKKVRHLKKGRNTWLPAKKFPIFGGFVPYYHLLFIADIFDDIFDDAFIVRVCFDEILHLF